MKSSSVDDAVPTDVRSTAVANVRVRTAVSPLATIHLSGCPLGATLASRNAVVAGLRPSSSPDVRTHFVSGPPIGSPSENGSAGDGLSLMYFVFVPPPTPYRPFTVVRLIVVTSVAFGGRMPQWVRFPLSSSFSRALFPGVFAGSRMNNCSSRSGVGDAVRNNAGALEPDGSVTVGLVSVVWSRVVKKLLSGAVSRSMRNELGGLVTSPYVIMRPLNRVKARDRAVFFPNEMNGPRERNVPPPARLAALRA